LCQTIVYASSAGKKYWAEMARMLGLVDKDDGIGFAAGLDETTASFERHQANCM